MSSRGASFIHWGSNPIDRLCVLRVTLHGSVDYYTSVEWGSVCQHLAVSSQEGLNFSFSLLPMSMASIGELASQTELGPTSFSLAPGLYA